MSLMTGTIQQINVIGLSKYTVYVFKLAGMTSKGIGGFSAEKSQRTDEDSKCLFP